MSANNIGAELYYSGAWNTARSYERATVTSKWGLADEGTALGQSSCVLQLDNRAGDMSPDDARSSLYGLIGRNTPGRVALSLGLTSGDYQDTSDDFSVTVVDDWGTIWQTAAPGAGSSADFDVTGGFGTMSLATADSASPRIAYAQNVNARDVDCSVTFKAPQATGARLQIAIVFRGLSTSSYFSGRVELGLSNQVIVGILSRDGTLLDSVTVAGLTHTGTGQPLRMRVLAVGHRMHIKCWIAASAEPDEWQLVVADTDVDTSETPTPGWVGISSTRETGNTNSSTPQFSYDDWVSTTLVPIADGAVSKWEPDRDAGYDPDAHAGGDQWTDIEITGPSERVNSSKTPLSAIRRSFLAASPDAYWPLEDPEGTTAPASGLQGGPPGSIASGSAAFGVTPDNLVSASVSLVDAYTTTGLIELPLEGFADGGIQVEMVAGALSGVAADALIEIVTSSNDHWFVTTFSLAGDGLMHHLVLHAVENGANVDYLQYTDGVLSSSFSIAGDVGTPLALRIGGSISAGGSGSTFYVGHVMAFGVTADFPDAFHDPTGRGLCAIGYRGESAPDRFMRLCEEHGIAGGVHGDTSLGANGMGMQPIETLPNLFVECAATDLGMVYDGRGWSGLEFRTGRSLSNQTAAMALEYGVNVAPPLKPATDSLGIANAITANDNSGATALAERSSGPLNTSDPLADPEGIGRTESSADVNVQTPNVQLPDIAGWTLHVSTWPGARYKTVVLDLSKHPELLVDAMNLRPGDLITIDSLDADQVELLVLGGEHSLVTYHHVLTLNCTPAGPYRVGTVGNTSDFARIGSNSSSLAADFTPGTSTSMSVAVTGTLWSTTAPPFHIRVGGIVFNVTAISGASSPQTFTVDQTPVNGITSRVLRTTDPDALKRINVEHPVYVGA